MAEGITKKLREPIGKYYLLECNALAEIARLNSQFEAALNALALIFACEVELNVPGDAIEDVKENGAIFTAYKITLMRIVR